MDTVEPKQDVSAHAGCTAPGCGKPLQARVAYCPFCGQPQARSAARPEPSKLPEPEKLPAEPPAPKEPAELPESRKPPEPAELSKILRPPQLPKPPTPKPLKPPEPPKLKEAAPPSTKRRSRWVGALVWVVLILAGWAWLAGKHGDESHDTSLAQTCAGLVRSMDAALSQGDVSGASAALASGRATCSGADLSPFEPLAVRLHALESRDRACTALIDRLRVALNAGKPADVAGMEHGSASECARRDEVQKLVKQARTRVEAGTAAIDRGFVQVEAGNLDGAEAELASALHSNQFAVGADGLKRAIAERRTAMSVVFKPVLQPPVVSAPEPPAGTGEVLRSLLAEGTEALARKDYAQAKSSARSALSIAPKNAEAGRLLHDAELEENQALQDMDVK